MREFGAHSGQVPIAQGAVVNTRIKDAGLVVLASLSLVVSAQATSLSTWTWTPSPRFNDQGQPLAAAEAYEIFRTCGAEPESLIATVEGDTIWQHQDEAGVSYALRVRGVDRWGRRGPMSAQSPTYTPPLVSGVSQREAPAVGPAVPNPFNPRTVISYVVPEGMNGSAALAIYDLRGRLVCRLTTADAPGRHEAVWDGHDAGGRRMATGTYLAIYRVGGFSSTLKMTLLE